MTLTAYLNGKSSWKQRKNLQLNIVPFLLLLFDYSLKMDFGYLNWSYLEVQAHFHHLELIRLSQNWSLGSPSLYKHDHQLYLCIKNVNHLPMTTCKIQHLA